MENLKVLNLYAGIGGNRKLWGGVDVTAVEMDAEIARIYQDYFPDDTVVVGDAHQYLIDHYKEFDFIWSSPPCQSHSKLGFLRAKSNSKVTGAYLYDPKYVDMKLYQEIIFLDKFFEGKWVVENVNPYYKPLIPAKKIDRHLYWSNFNIGSTSNGSDNIEHGTRKEWEMKYGYDLSEYSIKKRTDTILRNCVHPETGRYILNRARGIIEKSDTKQGALFT